MRFPYRGAGIGLLLDGKILMGRRSDHPFHGTWCVPGGTRDKALDSDDLSTAIRELREETSVDFMKLDAAYIGQWSLKLPFFRWTTFFYRISSFDQDLVPNEFYELQWLEPSAVLEKTDRKKHFRPFTRSEVRCLADIL